MDPIFYHQYTPVMLAYMAVCQNLVPLVNIKIAGKWMFIPLKMVLIGIDPYPYTSTMDPSWVLYPHCGSAPLAVAPATLDATRPWRRSAAPRSSPRSSSGVVGNSPKHGEIHGKYCTLW